MKNEDRKEMKITEANLLIGMWGTYKFGNLTEENVFMLTNFMNVEITRNFIKVYWTPRGKFSKHFPLLQHISVFVLYYEIFLGSDRDHGLRELPPSLLTLFSLYI